MKKKVALENVFFLEIWSFVTTCDIVTMLNLTRLCISVKEGLCEVCLCRHGG
jgi:hypothetical protein